MAIEVEGIARVDLDGQPAAQKLDGLQAKAKQLRDELKAVRSQDIVDERKVKEIKAEYAKLQGEIKKVNLEAKDYANIVKNLSGASINELTKLQRQLQFETKKMTRNTEEYIQKNKQLSLVKTELEKVRREQAAINSASGSWLGNLSDGFNRYMGMMAAVSAAMIGTVISLRKTVDAANEYEKSLDSVSALTGLVGDDLQWIGDQAKAMSVGMAEGSVRITKSAADINRAFEVMGSKRPELLAVKEDLRSVTEDAIILSQAANGELEPSVQALAISLNQFNASADQSRKFINVIAAGSKAGAGDIAYISTAIEKAGTSASGANVSFEEINALIQTLAPKITDASRAGNSLEKILIKLQGGADKFNPAIVGMDKALENLAKENMNVTQLTKTFGEEHFNAAQILVNSVADYKKYKDAVTDTNTAIEQATINTDNNASKLEQAQNKVNLMSIELGERLAPALTFSTNAFSYMLKIIIHVIDNWELYKRIIIVTTTAITAYTIATKGAAMATWLINTATKAATIAQNLFNAAVTKNPLGALVTVLATAVAGIWAYYSATDKAVETQKDLNKEISTTDKLLANKKSIDERMKIVNDLSKKQLQDLKSSVEDEIAVFDDQKARLAQIQTQMGEIEIEIETATSLEKRALGRENKKLWEEREKLLTETELAENKKRLNEYIKTIDTKLAYKPADKETKSFTEKVKAPDESSDPDIDYSFMEPWNLFADETKSFWNEVTKDIKVANLDAITSTTDAELEELEKRKQAQLDYANYIKSLNAEKYQNYADVFSAMASITDSVLTSVEKRFGKNSEEYKRMVIVQAGIKIAADTASAISAVIAASETNPANAVTFGGAAIAQTISGIARVLANVMQAKNMLAEAKGYAKGGTIPYKQLAWVGEAGPEYMIPNEGLKNPTINRAIQMLEYARTSGQMRTINFDQAMQATAPAALGSQSSSTAQSNNTELLMLQLIAEVQNLNQRPVKAQVSYFEIEHKADKISEIRSRVTPKAK